MEKFDAKVQVNKEHYFHKSISKTGFINSYYQLKDVLPLNPNKVLIIGVGIGFEEYYLEKLDIKVTTLDIDKNLNPDYIASVDNLPEEIKKEQYDAILCSHVLEHLPFEYFNRILEDLSKIGCYLVLYLPPSVLQFKLSIALRPLFDKSLTFSLPILFWKKYKFNGQHYWQPYRKNHPMEVVRKVIKKHYKIIKEYQNPDWHYSYNFILKSKRFD